MGAPTQEKVDKAVDRMGLNHEALGLGFALNIIELETNRMRSEMGKGFPLAAERLALRIEGALKAVLTAKRARAEAITIEGFDHEPA